MANTLAKYAHIKQDLLTDGISEGKLKAFEKLSLSLNEVVPEPVEEPTLVPPLTLIKTANDYFLVAFEEMDPNDPFTLLSEGVKGKAFPIAVASKTPLAIQIGEGPLEFGDFNIPFSQLDIDQPFPESVTMMLIKRDGSNKSYTATKSVDDTIPLADSGIAYNSETDTFSVIIGGA